MSDGGAPPPPQRRGWLRAEWLRARRPGAGWLRAATDRVPTRWFAAIGTAVFLAATAAFGGLATASEPGPAAIEAGTEYRNDEFAITVERAVLLDEFPEAGAFVDEDGNERVLAVQMSIENLWSEPLTAGPLTLTESLSIEELGDIPMESVARFDDATTSPWLQPGVPAEIVLTWIIDADDFVAGDVLHLTLNDLSLYTGSFVITGQSWEDPVPAATLTLVVTDAGSGS
jgi:hypothetical protein